MKNIVDSKRLGFKSVDLKESIENDVMNTFKDKGYRDKHFYIFNVYRVLGFLTSFISVIFAVAFFLLLSSSWVNVYSFAGVIILILASLIIVCIEVAKRLSLGIFFIDFLKYRKVNAIFLFLVIVCSLSVGLSYYGSQLLPDFISTKVDNSNVDSLKSFYEKKEKEVTANYLYKPTKTITKKGMVALEKLQKEKEVEIKIARDKNKKEEEKTEKSEIESYLYFSIGSIVNEILIILFSFFIFNFKYNCYVEIISKDKNSKAICLNCKVDFVKTNPNKSFCGVKCKNEYHRKKP